ncbi:AMP-binding protein [Nocardioides nitrophenolicus]|uniref:AMP-binding protein n=1 Tax=Nocardioides nitrophenolicus TaxID=60489 RepID=UPI00195AE3C2|nr:AMP-binding protein [Nocardioides nitrophenolicus]MBM7517058.1 crotonobetaine/carnitine-CoA ligase [Nocardioides nitrophenolicus]
MLLTSEAASGVLTVADALAARAEAAPDGEVVRYVGGEPWTAGELWRRARAWAGGLDGVVAPGDVVLTAAEAGPDAIALTAAVSALGAVELPIAPDADARWTHHLTVTTRAVAVLATAARVTAQPLLTALATAAGLPLLRVDVDLPEGRDDLPARPPRAMAPTDPVLVMATSGTTGRAKAAVLPAGAPLRQARQVAMALRYGPDDVLLSYFAWHHINARHACFLPALLSGARIVVAPRFSASGFLEVVRSEAVTAFNFMGAVCAMLLAQPPSPYDREHALRVAYGGPAPADLVAAFRERYGVTLRQAYACTELGDVAITGVDELRPGAAGRPLDDYDVRVADERGRTVPEGRVGELLVRPRRAGQAFLGYAGDEEATREAWRDGWFRTRDRARLRDGWLYVEGRLGDVIRRRGVNIDPQQVEQALLAHDGVAQAAAVAVPSELTEDEVLVVVVPAPDRRLDPGALWEHCRARLPRHAVPRYLSVEDDLPHNANAKLDRAALRRRGLPPHAWDAGGRATHRREAP